jgi:acylphosphatase
MVPSPCSNARLQATVRGDVQGVGFRYATLETARRLGLTGWVRNDFDGSVEVIAEGSRVDLEALLGFLSHGPRAARVTAVDATWLDATHAFKEFVVRGSA